MTTIFFNVSRNDDGNKRGVPIVILEGTKEKLPFWNHKEMPDGEPRD